jgi:hypothetical protein
LVPDDSLGLPPPFLGEFSGFNFFVHSSPRGGPFYSLGLDLSLGLASGLLVDIDLDFPVPTDNLNSMTWVDPQIRVVTNVCLDNHCFSINDFITIPSKISKKKIFIGVKPTPT